MRDDAGPTSPKDSRVQPDDALYGLHAEVLQSMQAEVRERLTLLTPLDEAWQPADFLPDFSREAWRDDLHSLREGARSLNDETLVVLVGDMVTEEALPSYAVSLNTIAQDLNGASDRPWAVWLRGWTAEENRHGDLLNAYLRLTGRVDMRAVERTVHHLIASGFDPKTYPEPYAGLVYTSFQERATRISHGNVGKMASEQGVESLGRICRRIAGDEARHEAFYTAMMGLVFDRDPEGAMLAFHAMLRTVIAMPGRLMHDGRDPDLFDHFAIVAQRIGVYTVRDYAQIIEHLVRVWDIASRSVTGKAAKAQESLLKQAARYDSLAERIAETLTAQPRVPFAWIHGRTA